MRIAVINGPNLNKLGSRDTYTYGRETLAETNAKLQKAFPDVELNFFQSNSEGEIIDTIQSANADQSTVGIVINPGAYAHYSYAIADAMADCTLPVVEVHISNIHAREDFRAKTVTGASAAAIISGCGRMGYQLAITYILSIDNGSLPL